MNAFLALTLLAAAPADDFPVSTPTRADEPIAKVWSLAKAGEYLDAASVNWTRNQNCVTCHTNMPYLMARPRLAGDKGWQEVRKFFAEEAGKWATGGKPRGDAYVVATAAGLAFTDARAGKLTPESRQAFAKMWAVQKPTGEWNWLKCAWPPLEHDDYYGAVLAALAIGNAPDNYAQSADAKPGLEKLRTYLAKTPAPDLHHKLHLLWASTKLPGLMSVEEQQATIKAAIQRQHSDGGWSLPSLGTYSRRDETKTPNDPNAPSDGYGTGLVTYILQQAGTLASDPVIRKGIGWLKANQRESGRWYTRSLNNDKAHYITHAGTAFAVLALTEAGEPIAVR